MTVTIDTANGNKKYEVKLDRTENVRVLTIKLILLLAAPVVTIGATIYFMKVGTMENNGWLCVWICSTVLALASLCAFMVEILGTSAYAMKELEVANNATRHLIDTIKLAQSDEKLKGKEISGDGKGAATLEKNRGTVQVVSISVGGSNEQKT